MESIPMKLIKKKKKKKKKRAMAEKMTTVVIRASKNYKLEAYNKWNWPVWTPSN